MWGGGLEGCCIDYELEIPSDFLYCKMYILCATLVRGETGCHFEIIYMGVPCETQLLIAGGGRQRVSERRNG